MSIKIELDTEKFPNLCNMPDPAKQIQEFLERSEIPVIEAMVYSQAALLESDLEHMFLL